MSLALNLPCSTPVSVRVNCYVREYFALIKSFLIDKSIGIIAYPETDVYSVDYSLIHRIEYDKKEHFSLLFI